MAIVLARLISRSHVVIVHGGKLYEHVGIQARAFLTLTLIEGEGLDLEPG